MRERVVREAAEAEADRRQGEIVRLEAELAALQEQLDRRNQELYGRSTERRPLNTVKPAGSGKKKPRKGRKGHGPTAQPELARIEVKSKLTDDQLECGVCGGQLKPISTMAEKAQLVALEKRKVVLEQHIRLMYRCDCGECLKTAPGPLKLIPGGRYALSFTVHVAYQKYFAHLPLERQAKMFKHEGLSVSAAALCDQLDALAAALANTYEAVWRIIQAEKVLRADETPWAVLSNGFNENEQFYAWVAVGSKYVAFRLLDTRSAEGAGSILGGFSGTLMVDGLTSYPAAAKAGPGKPPKFKVANCHAHARRPFVECAKYWPTESAYVLDLYRELYAIERQGKAPGADLCSLRREKSTPLVDELFDWARKQQARNDVLPSSGLAKAVAYLLNHEPGLRVFLDDPAVPIDNNESERAVRPTVLGRLNYLGSRSRRGTEVHAISSTLVESAKRCGVPPEAYLLAATEHALIHVGGVLLPDEFKRQLDAARDPPARSG
jgi:transposase